MLTQHLSVNIFLEFQITGVVRLYELVPQLEKLSNECEQ